MLWLLFAFLSAFFQSLKDLIGKRSLENVDEYVVTWASRFFSLPLLLPLLWFHGVPSLSWKFWLVFPILLTLQAVGNILFFRAIKLGDLSLTVPMLAFSPLFLLGITPVMLGEYPTGLDSLGIMMIVGGSYLINLKAKKLGYLAPFRALIHNQGSKIMLFVALMFALISTLNKIVIQESNIFFWTAFDYSCFSLVLLPIMLRNSQAPAQKILANIKYLIPIGFCQGLMMLCFTKALELTLVAQVVAVKRLSILITIVLASLLFQESNFKERFLGAAIMLLGVILISLW